MSFFGDCLCFDLRSPEEVKGYRPETAYDSCHSMNIHCSVRQNLKSHPHLYRRT